MAQVQSELCLVQLPQGLISLFSQVHSILRTGTRPLNAHPTYAGSVLCTQRAPGECWECAPTVPQDEFCFPAGPCILALVNSLSGSLPWPFLILRMSLSFSCLCSAIYEISFCSQKIAVPASPFPGPALGPHCLFSCTWGQGRSHPAAPPPQASILLLPRHSGAGRAPSSLPTYPSSFLSSGSARATESRETGVPYTGRLAEEMSGDENPAHTLLPKPCTLV